MPRLYEKYMDKAREINEISKRYNYPFIAITSLNWCLGGTLFVFALYFKGIPQHVTFLTSMRFFGCPGV